MRRALVLAPIAQEAGETAQAYRTRVLDALIDQHLQYEDAERFGPTPPDAAAIEAAMASVRKRLTSEGKDPATEFARAGMTVDDVRASVERQLVVQRYLRSGSGPWRSPMRTAPAPSTRSTYAPERRAAGLPVPPYDQVARGDARARPSSEPSTRRSPSGWRNCATRRRSRSTRTPTAATGQGAPIVIATAPPAAATPDPPNSRRSKTGAGRLRAQPGGHPNGRPPSRWKWRWKTDWPAPSPLLRTSR